MEAGDDEAKFSTDLNMPLAAPVMQTRNKIIWNDFTVPQKNACLSMSNKVDIYLVTVLSKVVYSHIVHFIFNRVHSMYVFTL